MSLLTARLTAAEEVVRVTARSIHTWLRAGERVFLLEGSARIEAPGGVLSGDSMVIWFNERSSAKGGILTLTVYNESGGAGAITILQARGSLSVDERALLASAPSVDSDLLKRADGARKAAVREAALAATTAAAPPAQPVRPAPPMETTAATQEAPPSAVALEPSLATAPVPTAQTEAAPTEPAPSAVPAVPVETTAASVTVETTAGAPSIETTAAAAPIESTAAAPPIETTAPETPIETTATAVPIESTAAAPTAETTAAAPSIESTGVAPRTETTAVAPSVESTAEEETVEVKYGPLNEGQWRAETVKIGQRQAAVITGGIWVTFEQYRMTAARVVIYIPREEVETEDLQVFAEGGVVFTTPWATIEADRIFYDHATRRATLLNAAVLSKLSGSDEPLVLRAEKIRSLSEGRYQADNAYVTTCDFAQPHYRMQARRITVTPVKDAAGRESAIVTSQSNRIYVDRTPLFYWRSISRDVRETHIPLRRLQVGASKRFGGYVYTGWDALDILAGKSPDSWAARASKWADVIAELDYRSQRGPGLGLLGDYVKGDTRGSFIGYYTHDEGRDVTGVKPSVENRWRIWWRQRAFYDEYQIDTEISRISDRGFLNEYYEREAKEGKEQESYLYVKRPWEHVQAAFLYRQKLNDFQSQVEYLPQGRLDVVGMPLAGGSLIYNSVTRADNVRFNPDEALAVPSYQTQRIDTFHSLDLPLKTPVGFTATPFTTIRQSYFDETAEGGATGRYAGSVGAKFGLPPLWRTFDADSSLFDIHGLRHVAVFDATYEDVYNSTRKPTELLQFDDIDQVRVLQVATLRLSQRLQTKRSAVRPGEPARSVDLLGLDLEADLFPQDDRDNGGRRWSDVRYLSRLNLTDDVSLIGDGRYNVYDERLDKAGVWLRVDHSPRTSWAVGERYIRAISAQVLTARVDHEVTERWAVAALAQYDLQHHTGLVDELILRRNIHDYALDFYIRYDKGRNDTTGGINFYPLGALSPTPTYY